MRYLKETIKESKGNAALEFALIFPVFLLLLSGMINFGLILNNQNQLNTVVAAGMLYAFGNSSDTGQITTAMNNATNLTPLTVTVTTDCFCLDGSAPGCSNSCSDGSRLLRYVSVTAESQVELIPLAFGLLSNPYPTTFRGVIRTER